jgi:hypothetical protein
MKVLIAVVSEIDLAQAQVLTRELSSAVDVGAMHDVDHLADQLFQLGSKEEWIIIEEMQWERLMTEARSRNANFVSDYLLSPETTNLLSTISEVEKLEQVSKLFSVASQRQMFVLQLPFEEHS